MLLVAIAAVHWPGAIGLEGNLTCLSALCAGSIVHLSRAAAKAAPAAASVSLHFNSLTFGIDSIESILLQTSHQTQLIRRYAALPEEQIGFIYLLVEAIEMETIENPSFGIMKRVSI